MMRSIPSTRRGHPEGGIRTLSSDGVPGFFIIGAPKCGTTSMYEYLRTHPQVFLPRVKEPHFFAEDFPRYRPIQTEEEYRALFATRREHHVVVGEASVFYLYSQVAITRILQAQPEAKFIVMLRNPVELIHSLHAQLLFGFQEDEQDFRKAWELQELRSRGERIPRTCLEPAQLQYASVGRLGEQVSRLLERVPRHQVKLILFEDLVAEPAAVYGEVLTFLGVPDDGRTHFPAYNENRRHRAEWLTRLLMRPPFPLNWIKHTVKRVLGLQHTRLATAMYSGRPVPRAPLDPIMREVLVREFEPDVRNLEGLLGRDLKHWR